VLTSEGLMGREVSCTRTLPYPGASTCKCALCADHASDAHWACWAIPADALALVEATKALPCTAHNCTDCHLTSRSPISTSTSGASLRGMTVTSHHLGKEIARLLCSRCQRSASLRWRRCLGRKSYLRGAQHRPGESVCEVHVRRAGLLHQDGFALYRHVAADL